MLPVYHGSGKRVIVWNYFAEALRMDKGKVLTVVPARCGALIRFSGLEEIDGRMFHVRTVRTSSAFVRCVAYDTNSTQSNGFQP
jgi:hypothetical protein